MSEHEVRVKEPGPCFGCDHYKPSGCNYLGCYRHATNPSFDKYTFTDELSDDENDSDYSDHVCDEPGCNRITSCGFNTDDGYRTTCYDHHKKYLENLPTTER